jgi:hypothetical protein
MAQEQKPSKPTNEHGAPPEPASNMGNPSREAQDAAGDKATRTPALPGGSEAAPEAGSKRRT